LCTKPRREGVTLEWTELLNEELYDLYFSPTIIRVIKSSRMRRLVLTASMEKRRGA
jgi:hypothetical protein